MFLERRSFVEQAYQRVADESPLSYLLHNLVILSLLPALCKELAFRGFILSGLCRGLAAWPAILLSSFLFAVYHMHVYAVAPLFVLGVALGWFAERSGSLLPSLLLHAGCNWILLGGPLVVAAWLAAGPETVLPVLLPIAALCTGVALLIVWKMQGKIPTRLPEEEMSHASDST
jgi:membrane protease YdiL (CAAX protease family)